MTIRSRMRRITIRIIRIIGKKNIIINKANNDSTQGTGKKNTINTKTQKTKKKKKKNTTKKKEKNNKNKKEKNTITAEEDEE